MAYKSLTELKQENAAKEQKEQEGQPDPDELEPMQEEGEELEEQTGQSDDSEDDPDAEEVPAWMLTGDETDTSQQNLMPVKTHVRKRKALQGELKAKDDVIAELQQQVAALTQGTAQPAGQPQPAAQPQAKAPTVPKLVDFDGEDDPEAAYAAAMVEWSNTQVDARYQHNAQTQQAAAHKQQLERALDSHYERAATLIDAGNLTEDDYRNADSLLRQTAEGLQPGKGDLIIDMLLANIGDGSEKVVVSLGRNATNLNKFITALKDDPTGIKASIALGKLAAKFEGSGHSKVSSAPAPGKKATRGSSAVGGTSTAQERKFLKEYNAAHKVGDRNRAFRTRREAKKAGVDVTKW